MKTIRDLDLDNKTVIVRCDFNVPIKDGIVVDDTRVKAALPTINYLLSKNCKIILLSHLGRIKTEEDKTKYSLKPVHKCLSNLLNRKILFSSATSGTLLSDMVASLKNQDILLVENTRYEDLEGNKESGNDIKLASTWASMGDAFINDAFGTLHRAHASNVGLASLLPSGIGLLVEDELRHLELLDDPKRPYVVLLGGAKVVDKIGVIQQLVKKADHILIGGGMAFTFLKAKGLEVGKSLVDEGHLATCKKIMHDYPDKIILPEDVVVSTSMEDTSLAKTIAIDQFEKDEQGLDIGPKTVATFAPFLHEANTIVWNGPLGYFEKKPYDEGTKSVLNVLQTVSADVIIGGGDTVTAAKQFGFDNRNSYLSTGGGATLCYLEGKDLPGLTAIMKEGK